MKSILIVNENQLYRKAVSQVYLKLFCKVYEASTGLEAQSIIAQNHIDLALLDLSKRTVDGFALYRWIENENKSRDVPIIVSSSEKNHSFAF